MNALRRDLVERKLWMVVAILVVGIAAVPAFLLKGAAASTTPTVPTPAAATTAGAQTTTTATTASAEPVKVVLARIARDPFASGVPKLSSKPASTKSSSSSSSSSSSTATTATSTTTPSSSGSTSPPSMVSPTPIATTSGSSSSLTSSTTSTPSPTSTIASVPSGTQTTRASAPHSWTTYSVTVRYGKDGSVPAKTGIARLTPLPNVMQPEAMFMGVMAGGKSAVFALHAGLGHTGPGLCRPDHLRCSAIVLKAGQTEHLSIPIANGGHELIILRVVKIASSITHSRMGALSAYHRVSAAGQCELDLANPVSYDAVTGTISSVAKAACENHPNAVPFAYLVTTP